MTATARTMAWGGRLAVGGTLAFGFAACSDSAQHDAQATGLWLTALDGTRHEPIPGVDEGISVLLFSASDCPIANGYAPTIRALHAEYSARGVRMFLVNVEPTAAVDELVAHAIEYDLPRPILLDRDHALAARVGATVTPEAVVLRPGGETAYRGRIDDQYPALGVRRPEATKQELRDALDALLADELVAVSEVAAVGCLIEDWAR